MKFKKSMLILILAVFLISIAGVCASDVNDVPMASQDDTAMELTDENLITVEDSEPALITAANGEILSDCDDEIVGAENDLDELSANPGTYSGLSSEISTGGNIVLTHDYYTYDNGNTIVISINNSVIDGNGAIIDMAGSINMEAFNVTAPGVTIKNLTIKNVKVYDNGAAICFKNAGTVENCNFVNNNVSNLFGKGGAVYFNGTGNVINCNFTDNYGGYGGAVYFSTNGDVSGCSFVNNTAVISGGAVLIKKGGVITDCNFTNNFAVDGSAILIDGEGILENCIFVNNSVGSAVFIEEEGKLENCIFVNNSAEQYGGAVILDSSGTIQNCNFTDNQAEIDGGAIYIEVYGIVENCIFVNNNATRYGGAICFYEEGDVTDCIFVNNSANVGGALLIFENADVTNCNFTNNTASRAGALYFNMDGEVTDCIFTNNTAGDYGGAVWFTYEGIVENCIFVNNNAAQDGGAVYFYSDSEVNNCNFTNNNATRYGGAVYFYSAGEVNNCNFTNNNAEYGGAIDFDDDATVENCIFTNNSGKYGGAVFFYTAGDVTNCNFTNNSAGLYGGAVYINKNGIVENCNFNGNNASNGGAIRLYMGGIVTSCNFNGNNASNGSAIWLNGTDSLVSGCSFVNNSAEEDGIIFWRGDDGVVSGCVFVNNSAEDGIIYFHNQDSGKRLTINNNIFLNNYDYILHFDKRNLSSNVDYNWFGNNATDYDMAPATINVVIDNWLFLNATANPDAISVSESSDILFKLYSYSEENNGISDYDNSKLPVVNLTLTPTNGRVNTTHACLGEPVQYTPEGAGIGTLTASIENASHTVNVVIYGINTTLDASKVITVYGSDAEFVATLTDGNNNPIEGADVDLVLVTGDTTVINTTLITDGNGQISLAVGDLDPAVYYATVSYAGNLTYNPSEKEHIKVYVQKISTSITAPDISVVYNDAGELVATLTDVDGQTISDAKVSISINDVKKTLTTDENGQVKLSTKGLTPDNYTAVISYKASTYYYGSNTTANVEVSKANTTLTAFKVITVYGSDAEFTATLKDQYGKRVSDADINIVLKNGNTTALNTTLVSDEHGRVKLPVGDLVPAVYYATVTFAGNDLYKESSTDHIKVYVQKISTNITAPDITVDYNSGGELVVTLTDANGNNISDAKIRIELNGVKKTLTTDDNGQVKLSPDGLSPGSYIAEITYKATTYYYKSNATANVVITGVIGTVLTGTKVITVYGSDAEFVATLKDVNGNPISGADVHLVLLKSDNVAVNTTLITDDNGKASFAVGNLTPAVYYATVSYDGDDSHNSTAAEHIKVYVKKISTTLTVDPDYWHDEEMMDEYRATLTDANNQPVRDAKISLTFIDYKETLTTDANGEVVFDLSDLSDLDYGTYTAEFEYKATTYYYASNKTATVHLWDGYHYEPGWDD